MSQAVPHFSEEWLKAYNERLNGFKKQPEQKSEPANPVKPEKPGKTRGNPKRTPRAGRDASEPPVKLPEIPAPEMVVYAPGEILAPPMRAWDGKQTKTEERYNALVLGGKGRFEAVCLYLPGGGRYTPDFMTVDDGKVTFHEVKGSYRLQSQGRAHTAFQEAAAAFPFFTFVWACETKAKGTFEIRRIEPVAVGEGNV